MQELIKLHDNLASKEEDLTIAVQGDANIQEAVRKVAIARNLITETLTTKATVNREKIYELNEQVGHQLAVRIRQQTSDNTITKIKDPIKGLTCDSNEIRDAFHRYYEDLYTDTGKSQSKIDAYLDLADLLASKFLLTRDNQTNLVIRVIPGTVDFTYLTFNEGDTVPIAYKSHLYTSAEMRFSTVEKVLTAVQMAILKERALSQGKRMLVVTPCPALEAVTKASVSNSEALHPRWIQWAASLTSQDVMFIFNASLRSQEYLQYEFVHPAPLAMRPLEDLHCIIYTDGSAQVAHGSKHAYVSACAIVVGAMVNDEFKSSVVHTRTLGDCTAQLAELRALMLALEYADPSVTTLIVSDSYYCVQSYNEKLFFWIQNDFRDSKGSTMKHKMIWVRVAELKEKLPLVFVIHTLCHQRVGVHAVGNSLADEAAKSAVSKYLVAAVTRSKSKIDDDILAAVAATEKGGKYPTGFPSKYKYHLSPDKVPYVKIPEVGERLIPNLDRRATLITAAHEGVASAHAGVSATSLLPSRHDNWRRGWDTSDLLAPLKSKSENCPVPDTGKTWSLLPRIAAAYSPRPAVEESSHDQEIV
ncbi:uncharacterized protein LOC144784156 [Lissotriton helveticus]